MKAESKIGIVVIFAILIEAVGLLALRPQADAQTTQPTLGAEVDAKIAADQQTITALQQQLVASVAPNVSPAVAGFTVLAPGTELAPIFAGAPGNFICLPGKYPCTNCPTNKQNQTWIGCKGAEIDFSPVKGGAGGALQLNAMGTVIDGFNLVTANVNAAAGVSPGIIRVAYGVNYRTGGTPTAPNFPNYFGQGNVIRNCTLDASMGGIYIYGGATGTVIENNLFHRIAACAVYDCGYQTTVLHNSFPEGSQGEHGYRSMSDGSMGLNLAAMQSCLLFNWWDNRTSPPKKEDMTFREGCGNVVVGNVSLGWDSIGEQNTTNGMPYGSPSYWLGNIIPNAHGTGATVQANINTTLYFDGNFLTANPLAPMVTVFSAGNLVMTDSNRIINPPAGAKPAFSAIPGASGTFGGAVVALHDAPPPQETQTAH